jgi:spore maturation protein CgeB
MKILHVANFAYNKQGGSFYNCDRKISAGFVRNGHFVYEFSLRDMARMGTVFRTKRLGAGWVNKEVINLCHQIQPDILLLGHAQLLTNQTLATLRQQFKCMKIVSWYVDWVTHSEKANYLKQLAPYLDALFVTTGGEILKTLVPPTVIVAYFPNPVDSSVENLKNFEKQHFKHELIFCGSTGDDEQRKIILDALVTKFNDAFVCHGLFGKPQVQGCAYIEALSQSRMGLNYSRRNDIPLYSSDRIAQLTGNGLLTFSPTIPAFDLIYRPDELCYFSTTDELIQQVEYYVQYTKQAAIIAERGWHRAHTTCATERVCRFMEETILNKPYSEPYEWREHIFNRD